MRLDQYLSTVGIIKRRTIAKSMGDSGLILVNGAKAKPAHLIKTGDIITIKGNQAATIEVKNIPVGNVKKESRGEFFRIIDG